MTSDELQAWQDRFGISQVEAARRTKTPVPTYRHYLSGRRRIPPNFELLCHYVEKFGPFEQDGGSSEQSPDRRIGVDPGEGDG
jgi:predicted transcriptional regulator